WDVCRHLRARHADVPVIMLSARSAEAHRVLGLELGADDYLAKPFSMLELVARVRALLRRIEQLRSAPAAVRTLRFADVSLDTLHRSLQRGAVAVALTLREFDLLHFLLRHPGQAFSRAELLQRVWGAGYDGYEHTVNSHINRLRTKIEDDPREPKRIVTVWGVGYRFAEEVQ
ncbi:MAG: response regulator transcription factor, partial [Rubrivivax sp.]